MPFSLPSTLEKHMRKCVVNQKSLWPPVSHGTVAAVAAAGAVGAKSLLMPNNNIVPSAISGSNGGVTELPVRGGGSEEEL